MGLRLLLVEDDADSADAMARGLRRLGAEVIEAASVGQALEAARRMPVDALVSDLELGDASGLVLPAELARLLVRRLPAVALTLLAAGATRHQGPPPALGPA
jgi:CheY-like chemotaxis protein